MLNKKRYLPEPTRDEPICRDHVPPNFSTRGEEDEGDGSPRESDSQDPPPPPPTPVPIEGTKRGGVGDSSDDEEPPPPQEITGPKRGG